MNSRSLRLSSFQDLLGFRVDILVVFLLIGELKVVCNWIYSDTSVVAIAFKERTCSSG